jgi:hypothetical protein
MDWMMASRQPIPYYSMALLRYDTAFAAFIRPCRLTRRQSAPQGSEREDNQNLHTLSSSHAGPSAARANRTVSLPSVTNDDASNPVIHSLSDYAHVRDYYDFYDPSLGHYLRYNLYIQPPSTDERQRSLVVKKFNNSDMNAILVCAAAYTNPP